MQLKVYLFSFRYQNKCNSHFGWATACIKNTNKTAILAGQLQLFCVFFSFRYKTKATTAGQQLFYCFIFNIIVLVTILSNQYQGHLGWTTTRSMIFSALCNKCKDHAYWLDNSFFILFSVNKDAQCWLQYKLAYKSLLLDFWDNELKDGITVCILHSLETRGGKSPEQQYCRNALVQGLLTILSNQLEGLNGWQLQLLFVSALGTKYVKKLPLLCDMIKTSLFKTLQFWKTTLNNQFEGHLE